MNDITLIILFGVIYLLGVVVSMTLAAYAGRRDNSTEPISISSWSFVIAALVFLPIISIIICSLLKNFKNI